MDREEKVTTIALDSLGCKLNRAEMDELAVRFARAGYKLVSPRDVADIYVLNTCTITRVADSKSRQMLRSARRRNPAARLIAVGCYAQRAPRELERIDGIDLVLGNDSKASLLFLLEESGRLERATGSCSGIVNDYDERTRAFVKIQDGCRNFCAYCIIPFVRSRPASVPVEKVIAGIVDRVSAGYREIVLTGTEIGTYNSEGIGLGELIARILSETGVVRLRLSSLQPQEITPDLIRLWQDKRLCPHFHLSLQSGSNSVLGRMNRRYSVPDYQRAVSVIREGVPDVAVTTDIIVGFPGETEAEFEENVDFCRRMEFARIHVFPFSARPGTAAARMPQPVPQGVIKQRTRQMLALAEASRQNFQRRFFGTKMDVLWEQCIDGVWSGYTSNYIRVYSESGEDLTGKLLPVSMVKIYRDGVWGEIL